MSATLESEVKSLQDMARKTDDQINGLTKSFSGLIEQLKKTPAPGSPNASQVFGLPNARIGEDPLTSRGYSFLKMLGVVSNQIKPEQAKVELQVAERLHNTLSRDAGNQAYDYAGLGNRFLSPLGTSYLMDAFVPVDFRREMKSLVCAGVDKADHGEMKWMRTQHLKSLGYDSKALSWLNELTGGAIVAPPEMGELIELLRNKEALVNAGARVVPLPPQGRMKFPRQTSASTTYWVGENAPITESLVGTGEVTLQAKKLAVLIKAPNELIRFASPAAEALLRDDMTKSLALGLDLAGLQGTGTDTQPRGVINFKDIIKLTSSDPRPNGDAFSARDIYRFVSAVEEANAEFECFIMRPKSLYKWYQLRADAVAQGDNQGPFVFNLIREAGADTPATLAGYPVVKSTQVSQARTKGSSSNLTYIVGGMWSDLLIGMFGAIEFAATTQGDTSFANDQTWVRGILSADIQARHESAFVWMDNLDPTI
ncbi:phage major capsid protein [Candidatus Parcubacteria bacterium]|nr:MAG: phage major capsid protein [Candidatus Parcubacteria bacterium]